MQKREYTLHAEKKTEITITMQARRQQRVIFKVLNGKNKQTNKQQGGIYTQGIHFSKNYTKENIFGQINAK